MFTRKQALLTVALMTGLPLASWAATEAKTAAAAPAAPMTQPCPFADQDGDGFGPGMMRQGGRQGGMHQGKGVQGREGVGRGMHMMDTDALQKQLDEIKDPTVKAKFVDMVKARLAFEEAQLQSTKAFLDKQK
jgi:hypothetical protein